MKETSIILLVILASFVVEILFTVILIIFILYHKFGSSKTTYAEIKCSDLNNNNSVDAIGEIIKIVWGGETVELGQLPHMALIVSPAHKQYKGAMCGGTLISKYFVMTAGHCGNSVAQHGASITLGIIDMYDMSEAQKFKCVHVYFYNDSEIYKRPHDIALIRLDREVEFNWYIKPICLNTQLDIELTELTAAGWGKHEDTDGIHYTTLRQVLLEPMPDSKCSKNFPVRFIQPHFICAGHPTEYKDVCEGDSGGPLQMPVKSENIHTFLQVGVTSFGKPCIFTNQTCTVGGYTKVAFYIPWIKKIVWP